MEYPDPESRRLVTVVEPKAGQIATPTTWLFGPALRLSEAVCCVRVTDPVNPSGCVRHGKSRWPGEAAQEERAKQERIQRESYVDHPVAGHDREEEMEP